MNSFIYNLLYIVVPKGKASKVVSFAKKLGVNGAVTTMARGTVSDKLMNFLSIYCNEKELIIMSCKNENFKSIILDIVKKFNFEKPNNGILFSTRINMVLKGPLIEKSNDYEGGKMHKLITVIVEKGKAEDIVETANAAGARGGTIINARGAGTEKTMKLFNMEIEPQKEVLLIVAKNNDFEKIVDAIVEKHDITKKDSGIVFVQDVYEAYGLTNY